MDKSEGAFNQLHKNLVKYVTDKDIDKDGVPNVKDCQPMNPHMQDVIVTTKKGKKRYTAKELAKKATFAVGGAAIGAYKRVKAYRAKAPQRRAAQITRLQAQIKIAKEKKQLRKLKEQARGASPFGGVQRYFEGVAEAGRGQSLSPFTSPFGEPIKRKSKIRKVRRKTRSKTSKAKYIIRGGKAYPLG